MPDLGWQELAIILVIVVIIFGAGKLPEIGGALGKGIKEFKANSEGTGGLTGGNASRTAATSPSTDAVPQQVRADEI